MKIFVGEPSYTIRKGVVHLLNEFSEIDSIREFDSVEDIEDALQEETPDIMILNTSFGQTAINDILADSEKKVITLHLFNSPLPQNAIETHLSVVEGKPALLEKIEAALSKCKDDSRGENSEELSPREKLVLKHVALGQTNKEIAEKLYISTHTVISHRKNITRKLGIKTVSGLTVYAILNKIIGMNDVA